MGSSFEKVKQALATEAFAWQQHALQRLDQRHLTQGRVVNALLRGEVIEEYPDDYPFPSVLVLGWIGRKPIHAVVAYDSDRAFGYIVTVYVPDLERFRPDYRTRRVSHGPQS